MRPERNLKFTNFVEIIGFSRTILLCGNIYNNQQQTVLVLWFSGGGPWALGSKYTMADIVLTVILGRIELLNLGNTFDFSTRPLLVKYYQNLKSRESFTEAGIYCSW